MAFATKYRFSFQSAHGVDYTINIQQDGYDGAVLNRALGRGPVLKKQKNGPICGTSLELYAECAVGRDGEFSEIYTSDPKEFRVVVYRGSSGGSLIWTGFVSTELYSEPSIAPPYDVQIIATDGLGELKLVNYAKQGEVSVKSLLTYLLGVTGSYRTIYLATNLMKYGGSRQDIADWLIDLDYMADDEKTCYDVLTVLMHTLHATITAFGESWLIARETDIDGLLDSNGLSVVAITGSTVSVTRISGMKSKTAGQMGVADFWPVGYYSSAIEPARKSVTIASPWHIRNILLNPDFADGSNNWTLSHAAVITVPRTNGKVLRLGEYNNIQTQYYAGYAFQSVQLPSLKKGLRIVVSGVGTERQVIREVTVYAMYYSSGHTTYYGGENGWDTSASAAKENDRKTLAFNEQLQQELVIPSPDYDYAGTLSILIEGKHVDLNSIHCYIELDEMGYRDILHLDNGARGDDDEKEILHGRILSDEFDYEPALAGAFKQLVSGTKSFIYKFSDSASSNTDFLALTALSYALSAALPRLRREGTFDVSASITNLPPFLSFSGAIHIVETFEWDLLNDEAKMSALSLPAASLTIESEEVIPMTGSSSGRGSGSGGSGGGSGSGGSSSGVSMSDVAAYIGDQGFMTEVTAQDVEGALGYTPASTEDLASLGVALQAPSLKIYRGYDAQGQTAMVPSLKVYHPLLNSASINAECVLMVWRKRRGRRVVSTGHPQSVYISRWGEARGSHATTAPLTFARSKAIDDILQWILNTAVEGGGFTRAQMESMTLTTFKAYDSSYKFGFKVKGGGVYSILKRSRLYGIAIRYENPAWADCVSGPVAETTRQLKSDPTTYVDRYIYSEVAPIKIHINPNWSGYWRIGIQLQALLGPTK